MLSCFIVVEMRSFFVFNIFAKRPKVVFKYHKDHNEENNR